MEPALERLRVILTGAVQGVGFRPFVFRLAHELNLRGWVENNASGVALEVEGYSDAIAHFLPRLASEKPPHAFIQSLEPVWLDPYGYDHFEIRESKGGPKTAMILPDIATCPDCLSEILDPKNRRYRYPFTNCTHCGPRFSIIRALPYDRSNTTCNRSCNAQPARRNMRIRAIGVFMRSLTPALSADPSWHYGIGTAKSCRPKTPP